jgi:DNA-binding LacI/PurR family transcriptional regulator
MATLRDVAVSAGLSPATASRALSGARYVDERTRTRVMTAARDLGYRPNALARALRAKQTMTIGLIVPDIRNDFYAETASVLQRAFEERGYRLLLCISNNEAESDRSYLRTLTEFRVDAIVYVPSTPAGARGLLSAPKRIPIVELLRHTDEGVYDAIVSDDREGAITLTSHLVALKHRRIAMIAGPESLSTTRYRIAGYREVMRSAGLAARVERGPYTPEHGYKATRDLLAHESKPTAIFSSAGPLTVGVLRALKDIGAAVPDDVSLVAFEDPEWYAAQNPPLTCYALPLREMALVAVDLVTKRLAERTEAEPPATLRFSGRMIERTSTAPPNFRDSAIDFRKGLPHD